MSDTQKIPEPEDGQKAGPAGNVYHKAPRVHRARHADSEQAADLPDPTAVTPRRRTSRGNSRIDPITRRNLVIFLLTSAAMAAVLIVVIPIVNIDFHGNKDKGGATGKTAGTKTPEATNAQARVPRNPLGTNSQGIVDINTDDMRRANYLTRKAKALADAGEYDKAIATYREALDIWPYMARGWSQLGDAYMKKKDYGRAEVALSKAAENDPGNPEVLNDLGVSYLLQSKFDKAQSVFEAAMDVDASYAASYFNLGLCSLMQNDRAKARAQLDQFLRLKPDDPRGLRESASMKAAEGHYQDAMAELQKAIAQAPDWALLHCDAAAVSALLGDFDQSIRYLEKAEPLTSPATVYRLFQEPVFRTVRESEIGKVFEKDLIDRTRDIISEQQPATTPSSAPILSSDKASRD